MREIKFRKPVFYSDGSFDRFHYWGNINGETVLPVSLNNKREINYNDQQYTGLKDSKNVEIYEGDIVNLKDHTACYVVEYFADDNFSPCGCYLYRCLVTEEFRTMDYVAEVIGNIYENPDLITKECK